MRKRLVRASAYALCLALLAGQGAYMTAGSPVDPLESERPAVVEGRGWKSFSVCLGCVTSGLFLIKTGAILAAMSVPGSTVALGGCIAACHEAIF